MRPSNSTHWIGEAATISVASLFCHSEKVWQREPKFGSLCFNPDVPSEPDSNPDGCRVYCDDSTVTAIKFWLSLWSAKWYWVMYISSPEHFYLIYSFPYHRAQSTLEPSHRQPGTRLHPSCWWMMNMLISDLSQLIRKLCRLKPNTEPIDHDSFDFPSIQAPNNTRHSLRISSVTRSINPQ